MHSLRNSEVETLKKHSKDSTSNVGVESPYGKILYRGHPRNSFCYVPCRFVPRMSLKMIVGETPRCRSLVQRGCGFHRSFSSNFNGRNRNKAANMNADSVEAVVKFSKSGTSRVQCTISRWCFQRCFIFTRCVVQPPTSSHFCHRATSPFLRTNVSMSIAALSWNRPRTISHW